MPENLEFDTRNDFSGLVRDWRQRLEDIGSYKPVVPNQGIFPSEAAKVAELYQAIESDPAKRAAAFYEPHKFEEARKFYDEYSKYQNLVKEELNNRVAVPIRERFRAFEEGTGLEDYSPVDTYNNLGAFQAAEHESYSHQIPYEEGYAIDYRPFDAGYTPEGNRLIISPNTVTPLNENLAGVADIVFDSLRKGTLKRFPYSAFKEALSPGNVALLEEYLRKPFSLSSDSRDLLSTRLGLAYPEPLNSPQSISPSLTSDIERAGELFTTKYSRPAFDQMQGLIRTQFPGISKDAKEFLYSRIYTPTLERMDRAFGGNVSDLGNYYFSLDPVVAAAKGLQEFGQGLKRTPSALLPGAADLIPSEEAIRTGYREGLPAMGAQMGREFVQSLPTGAAAAAVLATPAAAPFAPGIGAGLVGTNAAKAVNEVVRQQTGEGIVPKLRQAIGTAPRTGVASPQRTTPAVTPQIRPLNQAQRAEMQRRQNRNELQRRVDLVKERFNPAKGEFGISELLFGR
jgi:hypothetical protein